MKPIELMGFFRGSWLVERRVSSSKESENIRASGRAEFFSVDQNILEYKESLEVNSNAGLLASYKSYFYEYCPESDKCIKYFDDKKLFYELIFKGGLVSGHHKCLDDLYEASYRIKADSVFTLEYKVSGPHKDYFILTEYHKPHCS